MKLVLRGSIVIAPVNSLSPSAAKSLGPRTAFLLQVASLSFSISYHFTVIGHFS